MAIMCSGRLPPASNKGDGPTKGAGGSDRSDRSRVDVARVSPRGGRAEGQGLPAPAWASLIRVGRPGLIRPQVFRGVEEEAGRSAQPQAHPLMQRVPRGGSGGSGWLSGCAGPRQPDVRSKNAFPKHSFASAFRAPMEGRGRQGALAGGIFAEMVGVRPLCGGPSSSADRE